MSKLSLLRPNLFKSKIWFLGIPVAILSLEVYAGILFGYLMGKVFAGKETGQKGIISSLAFNIGRYRIHFHHWFIGFWVFVSGLWYISLPFPQFSFGFLAGSIYHGIFSYSDWHEILKKQPKFIKKFYEFSNQKISRDRFNKKEQRDKTDYSRY